MGAAIIEVEIEVTLLSGMELPVARIAEVCRRYGVRELSVFGSAARGDFRPDSDIDLLVEFDPEARVGIVKFESLSEELQSLVGRPVDLVTKSGLKARMRAQILHEARLVYAA